MTWQAVIPVSHLPEEAHRISPMMLPEMWSVQRMAWEKPHSL